MDGVALASVISSALLGAGGIGAGVWTARRTSKEARQAEIRERRAASYLEVLRLVEREAHWREAASHNLPITQDDELAGVKRKVLPEAPSVTDRAWIDAHLAAYASDHVRSLYTTWRATMVAIEEWVEVLEFDYHENYEGPNTPTDEVKYRKLMDELHPPEREARRALGDGIAAELGHR